MFKILIQSQNKAHTRRQAWGILHQWLWRTVTGSSSPSFSSSSPGFPSCFLATLAPGCSRKAPGVQLPPVCAQCSFCFYRSAQPHPLSLPSFLTSNATSLGSSTATLPFKTATLAHHIVKSTFPSFFPTAPVTTQILTDPLTMFIFASPYQNSSARRALVTRDLGMFCLLMVPSTYHRVWHIICVPQ